jgi:alkaline phosphatase D
MKIPTVLSFLYVGNLLRDAHCSPLPELFAAKSMEEVEALMSKTKQRPAHEVLRGRRRLQDGTLETSNHILADRFGGEAGFFHSVASGDPLADAVIIWTRYTPVNVDDEITLEFRMAAIDPNLEVNAHLDPTLNENIKRGKVTVTAASDFTAKIDVTGLPSNTQFVYVFSDGQQVSDIGLTKTAPAPGDEDPDLIYAFFSCSHFTNGFFHAYDVASTIQDLDLWIHVGDYYYEYGLFDTYAREAAEQRDQFVLPIWETIDLQDYRNRHSTHVAHDEGLRNLRRRAPMIATWDDHETTNDSYGNVNQGTGAENHQETCLANATSPDADKAAAQCDRPEGDAVERFTAAAQAYWEWMPIRYVEGTMGEIQTGTLTQIIEWGDLATIASFDTRMSFRTEESTGASGKKGHPRTMKTFQNIGYCSHISARLISTLQPLQRTPL